METCLQFIASFSSLGIMLSTIIIACRSQKLTKQLAEERKKTDMEKRQIDNYIMMQEKFYLLKSKKPVDMANNTDQRRDYIKRYFDLCFEAFNLHKENAIKETIWLIWVEQMKDEMRPICYRAEWATRDPYSPAFRDFITKEIFVD